MTTPHEILGIGPTDETAVAVKAYKRLAQIYHPDKKGGDAAKFYAIRKALDEFIKAKPCPECANKGFITTRRGLGIIRTNCPLCWKK